MTGADLSRADLAGAKLFDANLTNSIIINPRNSLSMNLDVVPTTEKAISLQQKLARDRSPSLGRFLNRSLNMLLPFMVGLKIPFMSEETPKARCWFDVKDSACPGGFNGDPHAKS